MHVAVGLLRIGWMCGWTDGRTKTEGRSEWEKKRMIRCKKTEDRMKGWTISWTNWRWFEETTRALKNVVIKKRKNWKNECSFHTWTHIGANTSPLWRSFGARRISWDKPYGRVPTGRNWSAGSKVLWPQASCMLQKLFFVLLFNEI